MSLLIFEGWRLNDLVVEQTPLIAIFGRKYILKYLINVAST